jgi:hypothetical protein
MLFLASNRARVFLFACGLPAFAGPSVPGIKNFSQVDSHVYRGAQPTDAGFQYLAGMGVKTVVDLRESDGRAKAEESVVSRAGDEVHQHPDDRIDSAYRS